MLFDLLELNDNDGKRENNELNDETDKQTVNN